MSGGGGAFRRRLTALPGGRRGGGGGAGARPDLRAVGGGGGRRAPRPPRGSSRRRLPLLLAALVLGSLLLALLYLPARDGAGTAAATALVPVRQGVLELAFRTEALVIRDEAVYVAAVAGPLEKVVAEGQVVRAGTAVVKVGGVAVTTLAPGTISYQVDGLEAELNPARLPWLRGEAGAEAPAPGWLAGLPPPRSLLAGAAVRAGQPLFKVINLAGLWLVVSLPARPVENVVAVGDRPRVTLTALGSPDLRTTVAYRSPAAAGEVLLALAADSGFPDALLHPRRTPVRLVLDRQEGLIVPRAALVVADGRPGVRVAGAGGSRFVPVDVAGQGGDDEVVVAGDLRPGDPVLVPQNGPGGAKSMQP